MHLASFKTRCNENRWHKQTIFSSYRIMHCSDSSYFLIRFLIFVNPYQIVTFKLSRNMKPCTIYKPKYVTELIVCLSKWAIFSERDYGNKWNYKKRESDRLISQVFRVCPFFHFRGKLNIRYWHFCRLSYLVTHFIVFYVLHSPFFQVSRLRCSFSRSSIDTTLI